jgi:hypothetical protein
VFGPGPNRVQCSSSPNSHTRRKTARLSPEDFSPRRLPPSQLPRARATRLKWWLARSMTPIRSNRQQKPLLLSVSPFVLKAPSGIVVNFRRRQRLTASQIDFGDEPPLHVQRYMFSSIATELLQTKVGSVSALQ